MDWLSNIGNLLNQYANHQPGETPASAEQDFDHVSKVLPSDQISSGLAEAFRSDQTPPFGNMLGQLFGNSNNNMRATVINSLLAAAGPQLLSTILAKYRAGDQLPAHATQISPEQAEKIPPAAVEEMAHEAQQRDPSIVDQL